MARPTGTISVSDLLARKVLRPGERIEFRPRNAPVIEGVIQADGTIRVGSVVSNSLSTAARKAYTGAPVDGWLRWRVPRLGGKSLAEIREGVSQ